MRDQVSHLAYFDDLGRMAMVEPEEFTAKAEELIAVGGDPMHEHLLMGRSMGGDELLQWWGDAHRGMAEAFAGCRPLHPGALVRATDGCHVVRLGTVDGDLGARSGPRGRARSGTCSNRPSASRGSSRCPCSAVLVRGTRSDAAGGPDRCGAHCPVGEEWKWEAGSDGDRDGGGAAGSGVGDGVGAGVGDGAAAVGWCQGPRSTSASRSLSVATWPTPAL